MYSIYAMFVSLVAALLGLLLLPFGVMGSHLLLAFSVILLGGGVAYAGWLLYSDSFQSPDRADFRTVLRVALFSGVLSLIGQIALRHFFGFTGTMIYSFLLIGGFANATLPLIVFVLTTLLGALSVLPLFIIAMDEVDTSHHDFCRITFVNDVEDHREYFSASAERMMIFLIALSSAILAVLSGHIVILLAVLAINLYHAMPSARIARAARAVVLIAAGLTFLATLGTLPYEMKAISLALDVLPILFFDLVLLLYVLYRAGRIYKVGSAVLLFGSLFPLWLLSMGLAALLSLVFPLTPRFELYIVLFLLLLSVLLILLAARRKKGEAGRAPRGLVLRLLALALLLAVLLSVCLGAGLIPGVQLVWSGPAPEVDYWLYEGKTFTVDGVLYGLSTKGIIALKVVDTEAESITVKGYPGSYDEATPEAAKDLARVSAAYGREIYAIATGFLEDNDNIKSLTIASEVTLSYFDTACITGCDALESIYLHHTVATAVLGQRATAKGAFELAEGTLFKVGALSCVYDYYKTLAPTLGRRLVYAKDTYYRITMGIGYWVPGLASYKLSRAAGSFTATANVFGIKRVTLTRTFNGTGDHASVKVFSAGERVSCRNAGSATVSYSASGSAYQSAWILNAYYGFGGAGTVRTEESIFSVERSHTGEAHCNVGITGALTYDAE